MTRKKIIENILLWLRVDDVGYKGRHRRRMSWWLVILIGAILILAGAIWYIGSQVHGLQTIQVDTLDQIHEIRLELDQLAPTSQDAEKVSPDRSWNLSDTDRDLIERVVAAEARGEEYPGMAAVAQTIADRSTQWDMTPAEVVTQPYQYADPFQGVVSQEVKQAVSEVFDDGLRVWECPVLWFHESGISPGWSNSVIEVEKIGNHVFYRE